MISSVNMSTYGASVIPNSANSNNITISSQSMSSSLRVSETGLTDKGLALLAFLALQKDKENDEMSTPEKIALAAMLLGLSQSPQNIDITMQMSNSTQVISSLGYTSAATPVKQNIAPGTFYSASF